MVRPRLAAPGRKKRLIAGYGDGLVQDSHLLPFQTGPIIRQQQQFFNGRQHSGTRFYDCLRGCGATLGSGLLARERIRVAVLPQDAEQRHIQQFARGF